MMLPGIAGGLLLGNSGGPGSYVFSPGARSINTPFVAPGINRKKFSVSIWLKNENYSSTPYTNFMLTSSNFQSLQLVHYIHFYDYYSNQRNMLVEETNWFSTENPVVTSNLVPFINNKWHNIIIAFDSTQIVSTNRVSFYIDGTLYATNLIEHIPQNYEFVFMSSGYNLNIESNNDLYSSKTAFIQIIDGLKILPTDVGVNVNGVWYHKKYIGNYGAAGINLDGTMAFQDKVRNITFQRTNLNESNIDYADLPPYVSY